MAFSDGSGAILVRPDALNAKLTDIREGSAEATGSLLRARERIARQAADQTKQATTLRELVRKIDLEVAAERERWGQVEVVA